VADEETVETTPAESVEAIPAAEAASPAEDAPTDLTATETPAVVADASGDTPTGELADQGTPSDFEGAVRQRRGRDRKVITHAQAHIRATFNNTIITIADLQGNTIFWTSSGTVGFKGSRKSTPYASQVAAEQAARKAGEFGIRKLDVIVRGSGSSRETAIRTLQSMGLEVTGIKDVTPIPHNGCRPKKRRMR